MALARAVVAGERRALARAITLLESTRPDHRQVAEALGAALVPRGGGAMRIGISGVPGVGKSTFIQVLGLMAIGLGHRVAVLAVDPSSPRSGGSILGDKTRMEALAREPAAFIRPSPARGSLGGVARRTREAMLACEAAGFDVVVVETVGVGQSEHAVADLVDMFVLLLAPAGGDDLQGIKRGILELADAVVVTKADGDLAPAAERTRAHFASALALTRAGPGGRAPAVITCSALENRGIDRVWDEIQRFRDAETASGRLAVRRASQARAWMWSELTESLAERLREHPAARRLLKDLDGRVAAGRLSPQAAARRILAAFLDRPAPRRSARSHPGTRRRPGSPA